MHTFPVPTGTPIGRPKRTIEDEPAPLEVPTIEPVPMRPEQPVPQKVPA